MNKKRLLTMLAGKLQYGPELILNGGFETAGVPSNRFASWTQSGTEVTDETSVVYAGGHAAKIPYTTANNYIYQAFTVVPTLKYTFSMYARGDGTNAGRYRLLDVTNSVYVVDYTSTLITGTSYGNVTFTVTAPAGCLSFRLYLYSHSAASAGVYFDEVSAKRNFS